LKLVELAAQAGVAVDEVGVVQGQLVNFVRQQVAGNPAANH
jgi:hypothetical protein